jgi:D-alanine-D-alanine ligase
MNLAERAAQSLSCSGPCRVDLLVTDGENEYVLEVNTLPGMTPTSLLPKIAAGAGFDYPSLCEAIVEGAQLHAGLPTRVDRPTFLQRDAQASVVASCEDEPVRRAAG